MNSEQLNQEVPVESNETGARRALLAALYGSALMVEATAAYEVIVQDASVDEITPRAIGGLVILGLAEIWRRATRR